ncbi:hypothetical protein BDZ45DRAFT_693513 [Acephala macrosclerotiorum]|nr:hypothetical protein BDZ45DRAFT_693513 [Acephala macrosclerotiorum]
MHMTRADEASHARVCGLKGRVLLAGLKHCSIHGWRGKTVNLSSKEKIVAVKNLLYVDLRSNEIWPMKQLAGRFYNLIQSQHPAEWKGEPTVRQVLLINAERCGYVLLSSLLPQVEVLKIRLLHLEGEKRITFTNTHGCVNVKLMNQNTIARIEGCIVESAGHVCMTDLLSQVRRKEPTTFSSVIRNILNRRKLSRL